MALRMVTRTCVMGDPIATRDADPLTTTIYDHGL